MTVTDKNLAFDVLKAQEDDHDYLTIIKIFVFKFFNSQRDALEVESSIASLIAQLHCLCSEWKTKVSVDCVVFNYLHDLVMPQIYQRFKTEDQFYFNKASELKNVTSEQLGAPVEWTISLSAAVVELANLDSYKSPLEKMWCLCTTYDLIFAELKMALINVISRHPDTDSNIPVVNNEDIIPILITVILQSKLVHLHSNFYYLDRFMGSLSENELFRHTVMVFREAVNRMRELSTQSLRPATVSLCREMDLVKLIQITDEMNIKLRVKEREITPYEAQLIEVTDLIVMSTNQNQILPNV
ncbi:hypothetical protein PPYR_05018 [Photinus pyralis]|uniref:VPS9 domain-containing protein n=1 Tax=Photinus pyralis TaxID=7054 RepID=A0A5N4AZQ6_PHOPY|nr:hypothetical protein PPYR_05018 [Photinus pyralis]